MDDMYLDVTQGYADDCQITQMQYHSFQPYSNNAFSNNDEIRISIQNMDAYTLPCESYIYIEGKVNTPTEAGVGTFDFTNNGLAFLFSEMKYEINGIEIQKLKYPGISSTLKGCCSYTPNDLHVLQNAGWDTDLSTYDNKYFVVNDKFRTWDLCEYPVLPTNTTHSWTVKSSSLLEKPRFAIIGFQTYRKNNLLKQSGQFDSCNLKNLKIHLNSEVYPYEDFQANFSDKQTTVLYKSYADFQKSYYYRDHCAPLLSKDIFQMKLPVIVVDLSRQNDNVKSSTVDMRIEFETTQSIPEKTAAYCLILHDQIVTYNPFNGDVRKM